MKLGVVGVVAMKNGLAKTVCAKHAAKIMLQLKMGVVNNEN